MEKALQLIKKERQRQISELGFDTKNDDKYKAGELALAGLCYATPPGLGTSVPTIWPWDARFWKPTPHDRKRELVKAGALIVAEIERLQRLKNK